MSRWEDVRDEIRRACGLNLLMVGECGEPGHTCAYAKDCRAVSISSWSESVVSPDTDNIIIDTYTGLNLLMVGECGEPVGDMVEMPESPESQSPHGRRVW